MNNYDDRMNDHADEHALMVQKFKSKMVKKDGVWLDDWVDDKDCEPSDKPTANDWLISLHEKKYMTYAK